jgi:hypothetical protein
MEVAIHIIVYSQLHDQNICSSSSVSTVRSICIVVFTTFNNHISSYLSDEGPSIFSQERQHSLTSRAPIWARKVTGCCRPSRSVGGNISLLPPAINMRTMMVAESGMFAPVVSVVGCAAPPEHSGSRCLQLRAFIFYQSSTNCKIVSFPRVSV